MTIPQRPSRHGSAKVAKVALLRVASPVEQAPVPLTASAIAAIAEQLRQSGYVVLAKPLLGELSAQLAARCLAADPARFHAAQIGRGSGKTRDNTIRGDVIRWLDGADGADQGYLRWMESLRLGLNEALYLGLLDYAGHYSIYGAGTGYAKHSDVLNGKRNRLLSTVLYLNDDWQADDGGELVLYDPSGETVVATITPTFGKMIIFLSDSFPHQVRLAQTTRRSIAGWFRGREAW